MENYICINGKKAELTEEQLKALGIEIPNDNPFDRAKRDKYYWVCNGMGYLLRCQEGNSFSGRDYYEAGNYCTSHKIMQQRVWHETLNRLLWRYSMTHKANRVDNKVWSIKYDYDNNSFNSGWVHYKTIFLGEIVFDTQEIAENAIEEIIKPFIATHPKFKF